LDALANASARAPLALTVDVSLYPSQLLTVEALQRPIESTGAAAIGVVDEAGVGAAGSQCLLQRCEGAGAKLARVPV
jgi:hypothetical protein